MKYILASASERRQELLHRLISDFDIKVSNFDESSISFDGYNISEYVIKLAQGKVLDVAKTTNDESVIIGADTIVALDNNILGKPKDEEDAFNMLKLLSGKTHRVYSAVVILNTDNNKIEKECIYTEVKFSDLTDEDIIKYIKTREPLDKAGAYGIQGLGGVFVEGINGCYYNVVGLPLNILNKMIKKVI